MSKRQDSWKKRGYTDEQIQNHLSFERYKANLARERKRKNNDKNKDLIARIKKDLLGKTFDNQTILSIRPTTDGQGFWYKVHKVFKDGSEGDFRYFSHFENYSKEDFIYWLSV